MKDLLKIGDETSLFFTVKPEDSAAFNGVEVHPFYATFALGRDAEWTCRQFVLKIKDEDEEGIGTFLNIQHQSPAMVGDAVCITATIESLDGNEIKCRWSAKVGERLIAQGDQGQKVLKKEKVQRLIQAIIND